MLTQAIIGVVRALNGLLEKVNSHGEAHFVKSGAPLYQGDVLTLLSGEAYIQFINGFPEALALNKSFPLDGISPALKFGAFNVNEEVIQEALAKGIDPSLMFDILGATAAGFDVGESYADIYSIIPMYGSGLVIAGHNTLPISFDNFGSGLVPLSLDSAPQGIAFKAIPETPTLDSTPDTTVITIPPAVISGIFVGDVFEAGGINNTIPGAPKFQGQITSSSGFNASSVTGQLGTFTLQESGKWTYELHGNSPNVDALKEGEVKIVSFDVKATDGSTQKINITIHGANDAIIAAPDVKTTPEDTVTTDNVLTNDTDPEGGTKAVTGFRIDGDSRDYQPGQTANIPGVGQLIIDATGAYTFTPAANYSGLVPEVTYTATDGNLEVSETLNITVTPVLDVTPVSLSASASVAEGGTITYTATLTHAAQGDVTVTLSNGAIITIVNGATSGTVDVPAPTDDVYVDAGTVSATIATATGGNFENLLINPAAADTAITDTINVTTVTLGAPVMAIEGDTITYTATVDNAVAGTDLVITLSNSQTITIPVGATTGSVTYDVRPDDAYLQSNENLTVSISSTSGGNYEALNTSSTVTTTVMDNDTAIADLSVTTQGVEGVTNVVYMVTLSTVNDTGVPISFDIGTSGGSAVSGADYTAIPVGAKITVAVGASTGTYTLPVINDALLESTEEVKATISNSSNGAVTINTATATATISDNETATVTLTANDANAAEAGPDSGQFTVDLGIINNTDAPIVVNYNITGTAANGVDYATLTGSVSIAVGQQTATIDIAPINDLLVESAETVIVTLTSTNNAAVGVNTTPATVTIADNDNPPVNTVPASLSVSEDNSLSISTVSASDADGNLTSTQIAVVNGTLNVSLGGGATISSGANSSGTLTLSGTQTQINAALATLVYTPVANYNGSDTLTVSSTDSGGNTDVDTIPITVDPVNDAPVNTVSGALTIYEDVGGFTDVGGVSVADIDSSFLKTTVSVLHGVVRVSLGGGATITGNDTSTVVISGTAAQINAALVGLRYVVAGNYNGPDTLTVLTDDGALTDTDTIAITVNPVNDAPAGTNTTITTQEDVARAFTAADFGFTDPNDSPADTFLAVKITTLPTSGSLTLSGVAVTAGQTISVANINSGLLVFTPAIDLHGAPYASFTFQVQDSGGTANGGVDVDLTPNTMTINVTAVADTPVIFAHVGLPTVTAGTEVINATFLGNTNENNIANWTSTRLNSNTFAEIPGGNGKIITSEATLFSQVAWAGQTASTNVFNSRWTKPTTGGNANKIIYNAGNAADDAQGVLLLNSGMLSPAERALTSYVISADLSASAASPQANGLGIVFGYVDTTHYYLVRWENPSTDYQPGGAQFENYPGQYQELSLIRMNGLDINNVPVITDLARAEFNADGTFNVVISVSSNGIKVDAQDLSNPNATANLNYVYGSVSGGATTAPALTRIGLYTFDNDSAVTWDNILINQPGTYQYTLQTEAYLKDIDGSETLSNITLTSIPAGVTLFDTVTSSNITITANSASVVPGHDIRMTSTTALTSAQINGIIAQVSATETSNGSATAAVTSVYLDIIGGYGNEALTGTNASDWIDGKEGNDTITGGQGTDVIIGGLGNDTLTGGNGPDQFVLIKGQGAASAGAATSTANDTITDFVVGIDTIVIKGTNITGVSVSAAVSNVFTIMLTYSGAPTEYFKVTLPNGAVLNDSGKDQLTGVVVSAGTATIDGTIVGATLYLDINANNQEDLGERLGVSDQYGHIEWVVDLGKLDVNGDGQYTLGEARMVQTGGFDIDTGLSYEINLFGPVGSAIISPLTSLLQAQLESGLDYSTANASLVAHLGLPAGTELIDLNPIMSTNEALAQNAAVMTAAVQFSEIAAIHYSTDEGHVSFMVFEAISKALLDLPEGAVADFSDTAFLQSIATYLNLGELAGPDVLEFMAASQRALQTSIDTLVPGENALAAISEVQHLTQGTYAQTLEFVTNGYLSSQILIDLSAIIFAYSSAVITYDELKVFDDQFNGILNNWENNLLGTQLDNDGSLLNLSTDYGHDIDSLMNTFIAAHDIPVEYHQDVQQAVADQDTNALSTVVPQGENVITPDANAHDDSSNSASPSAGMELHGGDGNDLMFGTIGDDHLYGGAGNDVIHGGLGNDVIQGGMGNDIMTGGGGRDIFVFDKTDIGDSPAIDTITDFKLDIGGDSSGDKSTLDLTDLFKDSTLSSTSLDSLLQISTVHNDETNQTDTVIKTDPTGGAHFNASPETIVLSGVDVVSVYGTADSAELINHMLAANVLVMGH